MAYNAAKAASNKKSDAKYMQILLKPNKAEGVEIRAAAAAAGQSLQGYILQAVRNRMEGPKNGAPLVEAEQAGQRVKLSVNAEALEDLRGPEETSAQAAARIISQAIQKERAHTEKRE